MTVALWTITVDVLHACDLFSAVNPAGFQRLAAIGRLSDFRKGQVVFRENEPCPGVYGDITLRVTAEVLWCASLNRPGDAAHIPIVRCLIGRRCGEPAARPTGAPSSGSEKPPRTLPVRWRRLPFADGLA
jgi:hypothetical protein